MSDQWIADISSAWPSLTGAKLKSLPGCIGVIGYIGCDYVSKNVSKARYQDWIDSGLYVALVIENGSTDMRGGSKAGAYIGQNWVRGAEAIGYDIANCIAFSSGDFNAVNQSDYNALSDAQAAFGSYMPHHAYYGDSDSGKVIVERSEAMYLWQSDSTSFSPGGLSSYAYLEQKYNDSRSAGLGLDVNNIHGTPLYFAGESTAKRNLLLGSDNMAYLAFQIDPATIPAQQLPFLSAARFTDEGNGIHWVADGNSYANLLLAQNVATLSDGTTAKINAFAPPMLISYSEFVHRYIERYAGQTVVLPTGVDLGSGVGKVYPQLVSNSLVPVPGGSVPNVVAAGGISNADLIAALNSNKTSYGV